MPTRKPFKVNDRVRMSAWGTKGDTGTVLKVIDTGKSPGGVRYIYRVRWDTSGSESSVEDRKLEEAPS